MNKTFQASVSLIRIKSLLSKLEDQIIFIKRSECENDPWSGHCALPGGGYEHVDNGLLGTAIRETKEEIGLTLKDSDFEKFVCTVKPKKRFNNRGLNLSCYEFEHTSMPSFFDASEVAEVFSVKICDFFEEKNYQYLEVIKEKQRALCFIYQKKFIIWGLTFAILMEYFLQTYPEKTLGLSFFQEYQERKNDVLEIDLTENISIGRN